MSRIIEIVLFLMPFLVFALWRWVVPASLPSPWFVGGLACFVALMFAALVWMRHLDAGDIAQPYTPDQLHDGRVVPGQPATPP